RAALDCRARLRREDGCATHGSHHPGAHQTAARRRVAVRTPGRWRIRAGVGVRGWISAHPHLRARAVADRTRLSADFMSWARARVPTRGPREIAHLANREALTCRGKRGFLGCLAGVPEKSRIWLCSECSPVGVSAISWGGCGVPGKLRV